ncbi:TetR/AcrR family transcriptional regulator [Mycetocola miduiensis]|uniref:Transcriptional regulator, TetR family n=1 Tax=Mycetocola miduiensis TaxID=995034 RepID=A0A1I4ZL07_9MICO|nr:TetR/AcrR family transcriptional regulator [Mycetocola miduiensis]SFN50743.1 transcriptional regulator, TetR family [Mycetocola miduiensis]
MSSAPDVSDQRMPHRGSTRDRILVAYEDLLIESGERGATLDAVAARAGVSKGGLLYHFGSKDGLAGGFLKRLRDLAEVDVSVMRSAPAGVVDYFIRTSVNAGTELDRALIAAARLAQTSDPRASEILAAIRTLWLDVVIEAVGDPVAARAILLISDGLYYNSALMGMGAPDPADVSDEGLQKLIDMVERLSTIAHGDPDAG